MSEQTTYVSATNNNEAELTATVYANRNLAASVNVGLKGDTGGYYVPSVDSSGNLSWTATETSMPTPATVNIKGQQGIQGIQGVQGIQGIQGEQGVQGEQGIQGIQGEKGDRGDNGTSVTHSWNGTVLTITSASGTSSADLKGAKGDQGDRGTDSITMSVGSEQPTTTIWLKIIE